MKREVIAGLNLYKATYQHGNIEGKACRLIVAKDADTALEELNSYEARDINLKLIEADISMVILRDENSVRFIQQ